MLDMNSVNSHLYKAPLKPRFIGQIKKIDMQKQPSRASLAIKESGKFTMPSDSTNGSIYPLLNSRPNAKPLHL